MRDSILATGQHVGTRAPACRRSRALPGIYWAIFLLLASRAPAVAIVCSVKPFPTYYVRSCSSAECNDSNDGTTPQTAWATLQHAVDHLNFVGTQNPNSLVIVGPGTYAEGDIDLKASGVAGFPIQIRADSTGTCTGDPPGPVTVDVKGLICSKPDFPPAPCEAGFLIFGASYVVIDGFHITNANLAGVEVRPGPNGEESVGAVVANNVIYNNGDTRLGRGVQVFDSTGTVVFNNLIINNTTTGIGVLGSPDARVINNTVYGNGGTGVVVAHDEVAPDVKNSGNRNSPGAWVINNIIDDPPISDTAFAVDVDENGKCDYIGAFNLLASNTVRSPTTPIDPSDLIGLDPRFVDPVNGDFALGAGSPAIDGGVVMASVLGLTDSSTNDNGVPDSGLVDLGYHAGHIGSPTLKTPPLTTQLLYVRRNGSDMFNDGSSPQNAFATVSGALARARAQTRIIVGPGTYSDNVGFDDRRPAGPLEVFGDSTGQLTGDTPGLPLVDAGHNGDGFNNVGRCSLVIDGVAVTNAGDPGSTDNGNGIYLKNAPNSIVRNTMAFSNAGVGINVENSDDVQIVNNLAYANGNISRLRGGGIQIGGDTGSKRALVQNNTCYANGVNGIQIGTATGPSTDAAVLYNISASNGQNGIQLGSNTTYDVDLPGYNGGYNLVFGETYGFGAGTPRQASDLDTLDPLFIDPAGPDGILGGLGYADDDFRLSHIATGQAIDSPAVDYSPVTAVIAGLADRTTRTDLVPDDGNVDGGFHYPAAVVYVTPTPAPPGSLVGDCNGDGYVTIDEVILAVNIALGTSPMSMCPAVDTNHDGIAEVNELIAAVNSVLGY
jgi:parallel beta-helix repeat protein